MHKFFIKITLLFILFILNLSCTELASKNEVIVIDNDLKTRFNESELRKEIAFNTLKQTIKGYNHFGFKSKKIVFIDFNKASTTRRLYLINLDSLTIEYQTFVAHGKNSGNNMASKFSNKEGSYKSSLGFYITAETYQGKHGYSLRLDGLEKGINDNARKRAIVIHGADYVSQDFITQNGRLGRSLGCPALDNDVSKELIDLIKNGVCIFVYKNDTSYFKKSSVFLDEMDKTTN